jgi:glycosyltransferase involved in cell wall biosynthesis/GT2 family glycosyltransferase
MSGHRPDRLRIGIATPDIVGPINNGGIGTAYYNLARLLVGAGHEVTIIYLLGQHCERGSIAHWIAHYRGLGIGFVPLPDNSGSHVDAPPARAMAHLVYRSLRELDGQFDVIHAPEWRGLAYQALVARRLGLAFAATRFVIGAHSPSAWHRGGMRQLIDDLDQLNTDFQEQESVRLADMVVSPSAYMLEWMGQNGWRLPENTFVLPNPELGAPGAAPEEWRPWEEGPRPIREIVFFGRLEERKGLLMFCRAVDMLHRQGRLRGTAVSFLGKVGAIGARPADAHIRRWAAGRGLDVDIHAQFDRERALGYLAAGHRLAVMPSFVENSPYTVLECLDRRIPFVATRVGGVAELIDPEYLQVACVAPDHRQLAEGIARKLDEGAVPIRPARRQAETNAAWVELHRSWQRDPFAMPAIATSRPPRISVCLVHHDRPHLLQQAISSLEAQTYQNFEVILVDDGSDRPDVEPLLSATRRRFAKRGWQVVVQENRYLGAARNTAARHAEGDYLLFMDDDNVAFPHELATFARAAVTSGADVLTSAMVVFHGYHPPRNPDEPGLTLWLPLGPSLALGVYQNCFGDANALVRRDTFWELGAFSEDYGVGCEDWEFFAKAVLHGCTLYAVPEPLFYYRVAGDSMVRSTDITANCARSFRSYAQALPAWQAETLEYALGAFLRPPAPLPVRDLEPLRQRVREMKASLSWRLTRPVRIAEMQFARLRDWIDHGMRKAALDQGQRLAMRSGDGDGITSLNS